MLSNKPSKQSSKTVELSAVPVIEQTAADSKPAKRTKPSSAAKTVAPAPQQAGHRHSKVTVPATPIKEEIVANIIVASARMNKDAVARLAYTFWEERSFAHGFADEDWHRAVKTLSAAS